MGVFDFNKKKLGFGLMRLPLLDEKNIANIDIEQVKEMVDLFLARGFTYFDTAWMYHDFKSEDAVKEALTSRHKRDKYTLASKLHFAFISTKEDRDTIFNKQLEKTGVSYFDYYLLHGIEDSTYDRYLEFDCFNWLRWQKAQGLVKHIGCSCHCSADLLDRILTEHPELEFVQLQINYLDWGDKNVQSKQCYRVATAHNVPIVVMEPLKGGTLVNLPPQAQALLDKAELRASDLALRFVADLPNVAMVLSGMSSLEQLKMNTDIMAYPMPIEAKERLLIRNIKHMLKDLNAIPCTNCSYCTTKCPKHIPINSFFALYNQDIHDVSSKIPQGDGSFWKAEDVYYNQVASAHAPAGDCIKCGECEKLCPQQLPIRDLLEKVKARFGR